MCFRCIFVLSRVQACPCSKRKKVKSERLKSRLSPSVSLPNNWRSETRTLSLRLFEIQPQTQELRFGDVGLFVRRRLVPIYSKCANDVGRLSWRALSRLRGRVISTAGFFRWPSQQKATTQRVRLWRQGCFPRGRTGCCDGPPIKVVVN